MSTWRDRARGFIADLQIPETATLQECRKAFRARGGEFHAGTYWGRRMWGQETRRELIRRRLVEPPKVETSPLFAADIVFPWKGESDGA